MQLESHTVVLCSSCCGCSALDVAVAAQVVQRCTRCSAARRRSPIIAAPPLSPVTTRPASHTRIRHAMERSFSVDDLVGGLYRLGQAGMGRTDSEAAFQEFLKRIPSATNLAAGGATNLAALDTPGLPTSASFAQVTDAAGLGGGVPRVPSLDLLAKLVMQGASAPQMSSAATVKAEAADGAHERACMRVRCGGCKQCGRRAAGKHDCYRPPSHHPPSLSPHHPLQSINQSPPRQPH